MSKLDSINSRICAERDNLKCSNNSNTGCCIGKKYVSKQTCKKWQDWKFNRKRNRGAYMKGQISDFMENNYDGYIIQYWKSAHGYFYQQGESDKSPRRISAGEYISALEFHNNW